MKLVEEYGRVFVSYVEQTTRQNRFISEVSKSRNTFTQTVRIQILYLGNSGSYKLVQGGLL